jgi:hypothetical protein
MVNIIAIHDLINPETGKSYKEDNLELVHKYNVGDLVEDKDTKVRLFVARQTRDCDGSLLYDLTIDLYKYYKEIEYKNEDYDRIRFTTHHCSCPGYPEESLKRIKKNAYKIDKELKTLIEKIDKKVDGKYK